MPGKPQVSLKREVFERLKKEAKRRNIPISHLLEEILEGGPHTKTGNSRKRR